jgi:formylglycine-generating enzyme required for sulfatase activity
MARFPVTNELYNSYVRAMGNNHPVLDWENKKDHPAVNVNWNTVIGYCQWLNNLFNADLLSGLALRLPTEAEWEKSARGTDGRGYPWGNDFDKDRCNANVDKIFGTTPVGLYSPQGDSPYGCADMSGNVWEWTHSLKKPYPYKANDGREDEKPYGSRVLRGGPVGWYSRCDYRNDYDILHFDGFIGFRVCLAPPLPK